MVRLPSACLTRSLALTSPSPSTSRTSAQVRSGQVRSPINTLATPCHPLPHLTFTLPHSPQLASPLQQMCVPYLAQMCDRCVILPPPRPPPSPGRH